jgi:hypothetical protein
VLDKVALGEVIVIVIFIIYLINPSFPAIMASFCGYPGCNAVYFGGSPTFRRNISPPKIRVPSELDGVATQNYAVFIANAMKT